MKKVFIILFFSISYQLIAQNEEIDIEKFAERLFQIQDENISYEDVYESLFLLYSNKINLNKSSPDELASLYILSPNQINHFFEHIEANGKLLSLNELQSISTFDIETIRSIKPFVTVRESETDTRPLIQRILSEENNYMLLRWTRRIEEQLGYTKAFPIDTFYVRDEDSQVTDTITSQPSRYSGSANKIYGRFRTSHKDDFSIGFTFEKDAGERFEFASGQKGFDFNSYHLFFEHKLGFDKIMVGDFQMQVGQGLIFGAGFSSGKGAETVNAVKRNTLGIRPYSSVLESGFFRGLGLSKSIGNFTMTVFYSNIQQDGNVKQASNPGLNSDDRNLEEFVNSIQNTGLHRTASELSTKDQLNEKSIGGTLEFKPTRRLTIGLAGLNTNYSVAVQKRPNNYNQFEFNGDHNYVASVNASYSWQNFSFFGESARSKSGGIGSIAGLMASLSPFIDASFLVRNYDRNFHSFYATSFSENSRTINETGVYWGLQFKPSRKHKLNAYYDKFSFPWLKFRTEAPSQGYEYLLRHTYNPTRQISMYVQLREQSREISVAEENVNILQEQIKRNYIFTIDYAVQPWLDLKTRVQSSTVRLGQSFTKGIAIIQDVNFTVWKIKVYSRMALFDSEDFNNAQYVYENDVLYAFSIPAYIGSGVRNYLMIRCDPLRNTSLWIRYARTEFRNTTSDRTVGSSLELSQGNVASEIKVMLRHKF
ncbi:MAG: helix-hairpin-helix domain-containing protein [Cyclobacteriaceae bacterium]